MATIKPMRGIRNNPHHTPPATIQISRLSGRSADQTIPSLKTILEPTMQVSGENGGHPAQYDQVRTALRDLLAHNYLIQDDTASIYVYEVTSNYGSQTGIWALTALTDYQSGKIKVHEHTLAESTAQLRGYRAFTGVEGTPVLLTYEPSAEVNRIIKTVCFSSPTTTYVNSEGKHQIWKISDIITINLLVRAFLEIQTVYLADGHHRLEAAALLAQGQQLTGGFQFDDISSLYIATDQLLIQPYHRVIIPDQVHEFDELFEKLSHRFYMQKSWANHQVIPDEKHLFGLYYRETWYYLGAKPGVYANKPTAGQADPAILQTEIFEPLFGIIDPRHDKQLEHVGGRNAMREIISLCRKYRHAMAFTLSPLSTTDLISISEASEILPPKSTWIDPKIPYGLILYQHNTLNYETS